VADFPRMLALGSLSMALALILIVPLTLYGLIAAHNENCAHLGRFRNLAAATSLLPLTLGVLPRRTQCPPSLAIQCPLPTDHSAHSALPPSPFSAQCPLTAWHCMHCPPSHAIQCPVPTDGVARCALPSLPRHAVPSAH
jgi:hypothetical protein